MEQAREKEERAREKDGVRNQRGNPRRAAAAWKKVSPPSGSSVRHGAVSRIHVEPSISRVSLPRDSVPTATQTARTRSLRGVEWKRSIGSEIPAADTSLGGQVYARSIIGEITASVFREYHTCITRDTKIRENFIGEQSQQSNNG